jgi:GDP-mannose 6-dehydrogenase
MIKYADNAFHALKVTFANEIGTLSRQFDVDAASVMEIFCQDQKLNISSRYLRPGAAFGGSCLPKDLRAVLDAARVEAVSLPMLSGVMESNRVQVEALLKRVTAAGRTRVGIVGLAFKEGTDDVRESPLAAVVENLTGKGYPVQIYDAHLSVASLVGRNRSFALAAIPHLAELLRNDLAQLVADCDTVVVSHRLTPAAWASVRWRPAQRVIDLVNVPELRTVPGYQGLYW